jgi:multimeric flavodoxin WrbA
MKVVAINGSPRKDGNTSILIRYIFEELEKEGITTELIQIGGHSVHGCTGCSKCFENKNGHCVINNDKVNGCIDKMVEADGIILGSPTYFADVTAEMKALMDRAGRVCAANCRLEDLSRSGGPFDGPFKLKVGVAVTVATRAGSIRAIDSMVNFFLITGMVTLGMTDGIANASGEVKEDEVGIARARNTGRKMAWLLKIKENAKNA